MHSSCGSQQQASQGFTGPTRSLSRMALRRLLSGDSSFLGGSSLPWPLRTSWLTPEWVIRERVWEKLGHSWSASCHLTLEMTHHHICQLLLITMTNLVKWGRGPHRSVKTRRWGSSKVFLEAHCYCYFPSGTECFHGDVRRQSKFSSLLVLYL